MEQGGDMKKNLYLTLGSELRALFKDLKTFNPSRSREVHLKMDQIILAASQIGGSILDEAKRLELDIDHFIENPEDPRFGAILRQHALRLEQETRDL